MPLRFLSGRLFSRPVAQTRTDRSVCATATRAPNSRRRRGLCPRLRLFDLLLLRGDIARGRLETAGDCAAEQVGSYRRVAFGRRVDGEVRKVEPVLSISAE